MGLYVHRNHSGLLGTGKLGGREVLYLTPTRYTITTRMILNQAVVLCITEWTPTCVLHCSHCEQCWVFADSAAQLT